MPDKNVAVSRETMRRLGHVVRRFLGSKAGAKARLLLIALLASMLAINGMNVLNSFVGRDFFSSIETRDHAGFVHYAWLYVAVFAGSMVALAGLIVRALQAGEWAPTALIAGLFALFGWQIGDFLRRNRPQTYRPDALPPNVLPRAGR